MTRELTNEEVNALVAQHLREHLLKPVRFGLRGDEVSECRKQIIELIALPKPKSIVRFIA